MKDVRKLLAQTFIKRAEERALKGRTRDKAAIEFYVGAAAYALAEHGEDSKEWNAAGLTAFLVASRGYAEVLDMAKEEAPKVKTLGEMEEAGEIPHASR